MAFFNLKLFRLRIIIPYGTYLDESRSLRCNLAYYHSHHCPVQHLCIKHSPLHYIFPPPSMENTDDTLPDQGIDSDNTLSIVSLFSGNYVICYIELMDYMISMTRAPPLETTQKTTTQIHLRSRALGTLLLLLKINMIMLSLPTKHTWTLEHKFELVRKKRPLRDKASRLSTATFTSMASGERRSIPESLLLPNANDSRDPANRRMSLDQGYG